MFMQGSILYCRDSSVLVTIAIQIRGDEQMDLAIYGAQSIALGAYEAIHNRYPARTVRCFLVTEMGNNPETLSGIPVLELEAFSKTLSAEEKENMEVLIATPEAVMPEIEKNLDEQEMFCHVRLTSSRWAELMSYHYTCKEEYLPLRALPPGFHRAKIQVFMAKYYKDKPLKGKYPIPEWITPIQVGAALCDERIADILDNDGENISAKNVNYSELTALYWMWKNRLLKSSTQISGNFADTPVSHSAVSKYEYYGLVHYRRILDLTEDDILRLADNDVDAVLPYPMPYEPDIEEHHKRYLKSEDWDAVRRVVAELQPAYAETFLEILKQPFFYNYNILLAKKKVLAEYCGWLFPILERIERYTMAENPDRADRYMGYIGETLTTLYFMSNKENLYIAHTGCRFLT